MLGMLESQPSFVTFSKARSLFSFQSKFSQFATGKVQAGPSPGQDIRKTRKRSPGIPRVHVISLLLSFFLLIIPRTHHKPSFFSFQCRRYHLLVYCGGNYYYQRVLGKTHGLAGVTPSLIGTLAAWNHYMPSFSDSDTYLSRSGSYQQTTSYYF